MTKNQARLFDVQFNYLFGLIQNNFQVELETYTEDNTEYVKKFIGLGCAQEKITPAPLYLPLSHANAYLQYAFPSARIVPIEHAEQSNTQSSWCNYASFKSEV